MIEGKGGVCRNNKNGPEFDLGPKHITCVAVAPPANFSLRHFAIVMRTDVLADNSSGASVSVCVAYSPERSK